jgi:hypothetical protein
LAHIHAPASWNQLCRLPTYRFKPNGRCTMKRVGRHKWDALHLLVRMSLSNCFRAIRKTHMLDRRACVARILSSLLAMSLFMASVLSRAAAKTCTKTVAIVALCKTQHFGQLCSWLSQAIACFFTVRSVSTLVISLLDC